MIPVGVRVWHKKPGEFYIIAINGPQPRKGWCTREALEEASGCSAWLSWHGNDVGNHVWVNNDWRKSGPWQKPLLFKIAYVLLSRMNSAPCTVTMDEFLGAYK